MVLNRFTETELDDPLRQTDKEINLGLKITLGFLRHFAHQTVVFHARRSPFCYARIHSKKVHRPDSCPRAFPTQRKVDQVAATGSPNTTAQKANGRDAYDGTIQRHHFTDIVIACKTFIVNCFSKPIRLLLILPIGAGSITGNDS